MIRLETKNYNKILTEKLQKYLHYHLEKLIDTNVLLIDMNVLQVSKYYLLVKVE